jgi:hypothetical protein
MTVSLWILLRTRNILDKIVEKIKILILLSITFSPNNVVYEVMWKNMVEPDGPQMTNTANALCVLGNWGYRLTFVMFNTCCFPRRQWLGERASPLSYMCSDSLVSFSTTPVSALQLNQPSSQWLLGTLSWSCEAVQSCWPNAEPRNV